jgi:hypothetical protein
MNVPNIWDVQVISVTACRTIQDNVYDYIPPSLPGSRALMLKQPECETAYHAVFNDVVNYDRSYTSTLQYAFMK